MSKMSEIEADAQAIASMMDFPNVRDHFAMAAITGILAGHPTVNSRLAAEWSYEIAEEMMKKRMENNDGTEVD
jgi:hypothetical protein